MFQWEDPMPSLLFVCLSMLFLVYAGYPFLLWAASQVVRRPVRKGDKTPPVSIVIAAYNEAAALAATLQNKLALDYPALMLEIIVVSDASTDATNDIARSFSHRGVRLLVQAERRGKTAALNRAVREARGDIIVVSDANSIYDKKALRNLVRNFEDDGVGYVTGRLAYAEAVPTAVSGGCSGYMAYENRVRTLETRLGSIVGVDGAIDAVRKKLYEPAPADVIQDFYIPLRIVERGYRVVYEPEALLIEPALEAPRDEWQMRVRVGLGGLAVLWKMRRLLNPLKFGFFAFQILVHKWLRYGAGFFQAAALAANVMLARTHPVFDVLLILQGIFYAGAALGGWGKGRLRDMKFCKYAYYLCLLNGASLWSFWKLARGQMSVVWEPRKGHLLTAKAR
jgi:cellulose synthase/poly-beta-1,6-N-acetylglucosamine synthase-like glycosyltransferase